ncbi:MAG: hypothetical protein A2284_09990 [Deltaproteobacteria bacterium RIFOXYA12_FULL_61_11]|nr:MAG: hypothetical protein A2284_09990 [Deltaproteobacteria bacterium RIFOXYA12_FULL_61_11]
MSASRSEVHDWQLERFALGELPEPGASELQSRLEADPELQRRLAALGESNRQLLTDYPPRTMAAAIRIRAEQQHSSRSRQVLLPLGATLALVLCLALPFFLSRPDHPGGEDTVRVKGNPTALLVFRKTDRGIERLTDGAPARAGDLLQVGYSSGESSFGCLFSLDGAGALTLHHPASRQTPALLSTSGRVLLPSAFRLDAAPGFERFYLFHSTVPFELTAFLASVEADRERWQAGNPPALPDTANLVTLVVRKP